MSANNALKQERREFVQLLGYWKSASGFFTALFSILPIGGTFVVALLPGNLRYIGPPLAVLLTAVILLFSYYVFRERDPRTIERAAIVYFGLGLVALFAYIFTWLTWVVQVGESWHLIGMRLTEEATRAVSQMKVPNEVGALLDRFGHSSENRIWEDRNIIQALLLGSFSCFFALIATTFFLLTVKLLRLR